MIRTLATLLLLAAALALHLNGVLPFLGRVDLDFDAVNVYLPLARRFFEMGAALFLTEPSLQAPPLAYLYPALLGADLASVKHANVLLSCALLLLVYRTASLWHSRMAGVLAALAYGASPLLKPFIPTALTEPPFLFLMGVWIWALSEWRVRDRAVYLPIAGIALGCALLTRATLFYALVAFVAFLAWRAWRHKERAVFVAHLLALTLPVAFIVKNLIAFHYPFYATGAGGALYLGTSPLFRGFDPGYLGLRFDVGAITRGASHLTIAADAMLGAAGRLLVATLGWGDLASMYAHKLAAFLFITNAESGDVFGLRTWRIATLILAAFGLAGMRDRWLRGVVAGVLAYQVVVHVPVLYQHRYSVGALDVWLAMLAGVGIAMLWERRRAIEMTAAACATLAGIMIGGYFAWNGGLPEPNVFGAENVLVWDNRGGVLRFEERRARIDIDIPDAPDFSPYYNHVLVLDSTLKSGVADEACGAALLTYKRNDRESVSAPLARKLHPDGMRHVQQIGAEVPLALDTGGQLRIEVTCAPGSVWEIHSVAVYSARGAAALRERLLSSGRPAQR